MRIITLTTDFGQGDYSVAALKGALYNCVPDACLVDISHQIMPYNIIQAAYVLLNTYTHFPKGTLHLIGVDAEQTPWQRQILVKYKGHYFLGTDNGILSLVCEERSEIEIVEIDQQQEACSFSSLKIFPAVAQALFSGKSLSQIGKPTPPILKEMTFFNLDVSSNAIIGSIIYIDTYGNAVSNIKKELFTSVQNNRSFEIYVALHRFTTIYDSYNAIAYNDKNAEGKAMLLFNHSGYLELAIYKSNILTIGAASSLMGVQYQDQISVYFKS